MEYTKEVKWIQSSKEFFADLPEEDGIYVIVARTKEKGDIVIYSGQTNNIQKRCYEHWSENEPNSMIKNIIKNYGNSIFVYYALVHGNSLDGHEKYLYDAFQPQTQSRAPSVDPKPVTLDSRLQKGKIKMNVLKLIEFA